MEVDGQSVLCLLYYFHLVDLAVVVSTEFVGKLCEIIRVLHALAHSLCVVCAVTADGSPCKRIVNALFCCLFDHVGNGCCAAGADVTHTVHAKVVFDLRNVVFKCHFYYLFLLNYITTPIPANCSAAGSSRNSANIRNPLIYFVNRWCLICCSP